MKNESYNNILKQLPFWDHLTFEERAKIYDNRQISFFNAKQKICGGECECLGLSIVVTGSLRAYLLSPEGREVSLYRIKPGEACLASAACVLHSITFETHVEVEEDCELIVVPKRIYSELLENNVFVRSESYKMGVGRFSDVLCVIERLLFLKLDQRLAILLLDESANLNSDRVNKTHEQIAADIGSAREAVSRTLKTMEKAGMIKLFRGGVKLLNKTDLQKIANN